MKNLIYILIFLPSLLFSQETKNMEFVGVRNITCESGQTINFEVDSGNILKVLSVTHSGEPGTGGQLETKLNNEYIYYNRVFQGIHFREPNFPFYLAEGNNSLYSYYGTSTLYTLEFKLITP